MAVRTQSLWILLAIFMVVIAIVLGVIVSTPLEQKPQPDTPPKWGDTPNTVRLE